MSTLLLTLSPSGTPGRNKTVHKKMFSLPNHSKTPDPAHKSRKFSRVPNFLPYSNIKRNNTRFRTIPRENSSLTNTSNNKIDLIKTDFESQGDEDKNINKFSNAMILNSIFNKTNMGNKTVSDFSDKSNENEWRKKIKNINSLLIEERRKSSGLIHENKELRVLNRKVITLLTSEQKDMLERGDIPENYEKDQSERDGNRAEVHSMYQNLYVKDLKEEINRLNTLNRQLRAQIHILQNKLEESTSEITKLNAKIKAYNEFLNQGISSNQLLITQQQINKTLDSPDKSSKIIETIDPSKNSKTVFPLDLKRMQALENFITVLGRSHSFIDICNKLIEYFS